MMQPVVIRLPKEEKRLLMFEAHRKGVSVAEIARNAIRAHLKTKKKKQETGAEVLLRWATRTDKPLIKTDVTSENYKQYLYGPKSRKFGYLWKKTK